ncbi:hypothetical protein [uncultured Microscilla sp.]|uniref:hypothetical protein n=1 Tax=uncultured Microscilla sp. TaxID=432653 RepID=UPI002604E84C|nr:hypothetical protein [uncultured Microscilla sp.]
MTKDTQMIYHSNFCKYAYYPEDKLLMGEWTNTDKLTQSIFKDELLKGELYAIEHCRPVCYLVDASKFWLPITPDTQRWMAENISPNYARYGLKKLAFLMSSEFITQLSIEQTNNTTFVRGVEKKHFEEEQPALNWLKS